MQPITTTKGVHMKHTATLFAAALLFASAAASAQQAPGATPSPAAEQKSLTAKLTRQQIDGFLAYPDQILILDVRRPDEISSIGGFPSYLSVQAKDLEANLAFIPQDRTIITLSNHAGRAIKAADLLLAKGFKVAGAAGAQDYEAQGGKLTKVAPPQPKVAGANQQAALP